MTEQVMAALEQRLVQEIRATMQGVQPTLDKQSEEIRKNGAASTATGKKTDEAHKRLDALEAELKQVREDRDAEAVKKGQLEQRLADAEKKLIRAGKMSDSDRRPDALRGRKDLLMRMGALGLALATGECGDQLREQIKSFQGQGGQNRYKRTVTRDAMRSAFGREKRSDITLGFTELDSMRDDVVLAAVLDPLRPISLRDIMTVLPLSGARTRYARETQYYPIATKTLAGATISAATPTAINVYSAAGFKVGATLYANAAGTEFGTITAINTSASPNTITVNSAAGFTYAEGDELWSLERTGVSQGLNKPEMKLTMESVSITTKTFPVRTAIHRQELRDIPAIQQRLVGRMQSQLRIDEEDQVLLGSGTGDELTGLVNTSGINTYLQSAHPGSSKLDAIRRSKTPITNYYHMPNASVVNTNDWEEIELLKGDDNHYVFVQIPIMGTQLTAVWRLAVVPTTAMTEGIFLTGDYRNGAAITEREGFDFAMTDSNKDHFEKNLIDLRVEMESGVEVYYPKAFCKGTFA